LITAVTNVFSVALSHRHFEAFPVGNVSASERLWGRIENIGEARTASNVFQSDVLTIAHVKLYPLRWATF
jgi:hypothetical protein